MELRPYQQAAINALMDCWRARPHAVPLIVAPTGSGKSLILSEICRLALSVKPQYRIFVVTHRKELIEQNSKELYGLLQIPIGIYSAGLGQKTIRSVTCAGVQSLFKKKVYADLVIVDEAHLIGPNDDSMYQKLISNFQNENSRVKFCGLTATAFRMDQGLLVGKFFTEICFDIPVRNLIEDGFLCNLISKPRGNLDFSNVERSGFDYKQTALEEKMSPLVPEHCREILALATGRKSILIFCSGVKHARDVAEYMQGLGESAQYVHGEMLAMQRDLIINGFKNGQTRILTNCDILTTGFNFPSLESITMLRATRSTGLYVQIVGRGMRTAEGKKDCLVLDFGGNISRHGPIDCIEIKSKKGNDKVEIARAPTKECPECGAVVSIRVLECSCGYLFSHASTVEPKATSAPILSQAEILDVDSVAKKVHNKEGKPPSLKIEYRCGLRTIYDFLCFEHGGYATQMAYRKWKLFADTIPRSTLDAYQTPIRKPKQIEVIKDGKYYRVIKWLGVKESEPDYYEELGINI